MPWWKGIGRKEWISWCWQEYFGSLQSAICSFLSHSNTTERPLLISALERWTTTVPTDFHVSTYPSLVSYCIVGILQYQHTVWRREIFSNSGITETAICIHSGKILWFEDLCVRWGTNTSENCNNLAWDVNHKDQAQTGNGKWGQTIGRQGGEKNRWRWNLQDSIGPQTSFSSEKRSFYPIPQLSPYFIPSPIPLSLPFYLGCYQSSIHPSVFFRYHQH